MAIYAKNIFMALCKHLRMQTNYIYVDLVCMPGYSGINCTDICPYPSYGERCQKYCECSNDTCDASTGCGTFTTGIFIKHKCCCSNFNFIGKHFFFILRCFRF